MIIMSLPNTSKILKLRVYKKASPAITVPLACIFAIGGFDVKRYRVTVDPSTRSIIYQPATDGE